MSVVKIPPVVKRVVVYKSLVQIWSPAQIDMNRPAIRIPGSADFKAERSMHIVVIYDLTAIPVIIPSFIITVYSSELIRMSEFIHIAVINLVFAGGKNVVILVSEFPTVMSDIHFIALSVTAVKAVS